MKKILFNIVIIVCLSSCQKEKITTSGMADDNFFLQVDGQSLPIKVAGNLDSKKILMIVHGGPGGSGLSYRTKHVIENIEKEFAIVYYDQRFAGASQGNGGIDDIGIFKTDLKKVIQLVKAKYGTDKKIYLMGHSWGGFLVPYFLAEAANQDMVNGWIQVDGAHNYALNDSLTKQMLLMFGEKEIAKNKNTDKWKEIVDFCKANIYNESADIIAKLNRYASQAEGYLDEVSAPNNNAISLNSLTANNFSATAQLSNIINSALIKKLDRQTYDKQISENLYKIKLPTKLFWGRYDFVCPIGLHEDIKKHIGSSDVSVSVFEKSGHSPMSNEEVDFWNVLVNWVKVH
jgi:pimeloyl-ACP methyl ester carboxylesterase